MKKILVWGALSLFCSSEVDAMVGAAGVPELPQELEAAVPQPPQKLILDEKNVGELKAALTGNRLHISIKAWGLDIGAVLLELDKDNVRWIEELSLSGCVFNYDQAEQLASIIMRNSSSLRYINCNLGEYDSVTDRGCIRVLDALSKCPNLHPHSTVTVSKKLAHLSSKLRDIGMARERIAEEVAGLKRVKEELSQLISQEKDRIQRNNS